MIAEPGADQGVESMRRCCFDLCRFLNIMAGRIAGGKAADASGHLLETRFLGQSYSVSLVCCSQGLQRFMAFMEEPCAEQFLLGRLARDGTARVSEYGVWLFLGYLLSQGLFHDFRRDLSESLELCARPRDYA